MKKKTSDLKLIVFLETLLLNIITVLHIRDSVQLKKVVFKMTELIIFLYVAMQNHRWGRLIKHTAYQRLCCVSSLCRNMEVMTQWYCQVSRIVKWILTDQREAKDNNMWKQAHFILTGKYVICSYIIILIWLCYKTDNFLAPHSAAFLLDICT